MTTTRPVCAGVGSQANSLARLLRWHRLGANLTQEELAFRARLSVRMIRNLERGRTAQPRGESVRLLAEALGLDDAARTELTAAAREAPRQPDQNPPADALAVLPPAGLTGRDDLVAEIVAAFQAAPCLITLCGLPGAGKTSVAAAVACHLWEDGHAVTWVSCRAPSTPVPWSPCDLAVGVPGAAGRLDERPAVLVLDAVEHRDDLARRVAELRAAHPTLRILSTGVRPLRTGFEHQWIVPPLAVPAEEAVTAADLDGVPAVEMFVARLRQCRPGYRLTDLDAPAVAALVRRLDGLPGALERAAGHARIFTPSELLRRHGSNPLALTGSLRDALASSVGLLGDADRAVLDDLAVFVGSWTLPLAAAVVADRDRVERSLDHLCELGLVESTQDGCTMRFHLLGSVRRLVRERPAGRDRLASTRRRHARAVLAAAARLADGLDGPRHRSCLREIDLLYPDIVAALAVAEPHDRRPAVVAAVARLRAEHDVVLHGGERRALDAAGPPPGGRGSEPRAGPGGRERQLLRIQGGRPTHGAGAVPHL